MLRRRMQRRAKAHARARVPGPILGAPAYGFSLPKGKGMFVRALSHAGTPAQMVQQVAWAGVKWVAVQAIWQHPDEDQLYNVAELPVYAKALRQAGIDVWVWGFPERAASRRAAFAKAMGQAAIAGIASGVMIDAEKPWIGASDPEAQDLVARVRSAAPNRLVALTSYGRPTTFPDFPWSGFASSCDMGLPQVYSSIYTNDQIGPDYQAEGVASYQALGFPAVVPALAAWDLSAAQMLEIYASTPKPAGAVIWWDWYNANEHGTWPAIRQAGAFSGAVSSL